MKRLKCIAAETCYALAEGLCAVADWLVNCADHWMCIHHFEAEPCKTCGEDFFEVSK